MLKMADVSANEDEFEDEIIERHPIHKYSITFKKLFPQVENSERIPTFLVDAYRRSRRPSRFPFLPN